MKLYGSGSRFTTEEFECKCGCGFGSKESDISRELIEKLNILRKHYGRALYVNSGARCRKYNDSKAVKGNMRSAHLPHTQTGQCRGVDLRVRYGSERYDILKLAFALGWERIGIAKSFVHLDVAWDLPKEVTWLY